MVLWGHSFGGYATLEIATRSDRYLSYIASSGYSDMPGVWGEFDSEGRIQPENGIFFRFNQGWTEVGQGGLAAPPWSDPDLYVSSSPFLRADRIKRPILFLTADMDFAPMSQSERMFSAVLRNGGEARMVTYWGEKHVIWSPANIRGLLRAGLRLARPNPFGLGSVHAARPRRSSQRRVHPSSAAIPRMDRMLATPDQRFRCQFGLCSRAID